NARPRRYYGRRSTDERAPAAILQNLRQSGRIQRRNRQAPDRVGYRRKRHLRKISVVALSRRWHHGWIADDTLHDAASFIRGKEERAVLSYGAAKGSTELVL